MFPNTRKGGMMVSINLQSHKFTGPSGSLDCLDDDDVTIKLAMLLEGECEGLGPKQAAEKFGYTRQRYFQIRTAFLKQGSAGLVNHKRGPKTTYRRTEEVVCQVIRHRFLDPDASTDIIAQKMNQGGFIISKRSVDRIFAQYGLQKKTLQLSTRSSQKNNRDLSHHERNND
jgi:hypothetical protein